MAFFPFVPQSVPASGGTFTGAVTVAGTLTTQAGISNTGAIISSGAGQFGGLLTTNGGISNSGSTITSSQAISTSGLTSVSAAGNLNSTLGSVDVQTAGQGLKVAEGSNAKQGLTAAMVAGTTTVANTSVTATSRILLTSQATGGTVGGENVSTRTAGTSFTITSTNAADTSQVAFQMFEVG